VQLISYLKKLLIDSTSSSLWKLIPQKFPAKLELLMMSTRSWSSEDTENLCTYSFVMSVLPIPMMSI